MSVADSLRRCIDSAVDTAPSPSFFSLAHPTAPIRPVNLIIHGSLGASDDGHREHDSSMPASDGVLMTNSLDVSDGIEMSCDSLPHFKNEDSRKSFGRVNGKRFSHAGDSSTTPSSSCEHTLLASEGNLICTLQRGTSSIVLWSVGHVACSPQQEGHIHPCAVDHSRDKNNISISISQATSVTIANSSVLEERQLAQREIASSPSSFLNISATNNSRHSQGSAHRYEESAISLSPLSCSPHPHLRSDPQSHCKCEQLLR